MTALKELTERIVAFRDARNWKQFHNPKDMAYGLMLEAAELAQHFQWKSEQEALDYLNSHRSEISNEIADVLYWVLLLCHDLEIDLPDAFARKMERNEAKYPVGKAKNSNKKYSELD